MGIRNRYLLGMNLKTDSCRTMEVIARVDFQKLVLFDLQTE